MCTIRSTFRDASVEECTDWTVYSYSRKSRIMKGVSNQHNSLQRRISKLRKTRPTLRPHPRSGMQANPRITAGNNPAVFCGFQANTFPFAELHGSEVNFLSSGFCPSGLSLSDNVYSWISSQFTKCSLFCKTLLCIISFNLVTMQRGYLFQICLTDVPGEG